MAVPLSVLLQLGLCLCCALHFSPASSATFSNNSCFIFGEVITINGSLITVNSTTSQNNTVYTVWVPVNDQDSTVVVRAVDQRNNSVGFWQNADQECNSSAQYHVGHLNDTILKANWVVPTSEDVTEVELQVFTVKLNHTTTLSSLKLGKRVKPTTLNASPGTFTTSTNSVNNLTTAMTTPNTTSKTTSMSTSKTTSMSTSKTTPKTTPMSTTKTTTMSTSKTTPKTTPMSTTKTTTMSTSKTTPMSTTKTTPMSTTKSLAVRALSSPTAGAIHVLLAFLTSKLLF